MKTYENSTIAMVILTVEEDKQLNLADFTAKYAPTWTREGYYHVSKLNAGTIYSPVEDTMVNLNEENKVAYRWTNLNAKKAN